MVQFFGSAKIIIFTIFNLVPILWLSNSYAHYGSQEKIQKYRVPVIESIPVHPIFKHTVCIGKPADGICYERWNYGVLLKTEKD